MKPVNEDRVLDRTRKPAKIGPSDTSDTVADRPGEPDLDTDASYTGERAGVGRDPHAELNVEYGVDQVVDEEAAGLGTGLDEAEEAQLGITDEELEEKNADEESDLVRKRKP